MDTTSCCFAPILLALGVNISAECSSSLSSSLDSEGVSPPDCKRILWHFTLLRRTFISRGHKDDMGYGVCPRWQLFACLSMNNNTNRSHSRKSR